MYKTSIYTHVNGVIQWLTHQKQQKILKKWYWYHLFKIFAVIDASLIACRR